MDEVNSLYLEHYEDALYRRNNFGQPCIWNCLKQDEHYIHIYHGIVGKTITHDYVRTSRKADAEIKSRINAKRKTGYKFLSELRDNISLPVKEALLGYLSKYLPDYRTTSDGTLLPMLAKVYDNSNNKVFKKIDSYIGQWKINGLRCFISAEKGKDLFNPIRLKFQSREGTYWHSLNVLEEYLLEAIPRNVLHFMIDEHYILDGELYLPNHSVNEINHYVKDATCEENKLLQYWCYDIAIDDEIQCHRNNFLISQLSKFVLPKNTYKEEHYNNSNRLVVLPSFEVVCDKDAITYRDYFINAGFEGLILRNPDAEYQYGKRNMSMIKYKKSTDGKFTIVDIYPEGVKRPDIPLFLLKNDVNDATFEVHVGGSHDYQTSILRNKTQYIGKEMYVEYGERSGVENVPFHVKNTYIL